MSCSPNVNPALMGATTAPAGPAPLSTAPAASQAGFMPRIGDIAPDFAAMTTKGEILFSRWQEGAWAMLFSHPADFTPVCSTELTEIARRQGEFTSRGVRPICLSIDSIHAHQAWRQDLIAHMGVSIDYPMIADHNGAIAQRYGMLHPGASATATVRAVFLIDTKRVIRAIVYYPMNVGRNVDELIRLIDGLQTADQHGVACPVNWRPGEKVIVPPPRTDQEVIDRQSNTALEGSAFYLKKKALA